MATATVLYSAVTTITMDLSNLASNSTFTSGRESAQIDNSSNKYIDAIVRGSVIVGTTPTANTSIAVFVFGSNTSLSTSNIHNLDGTDSAVSWSNAGLLYSSAKIAAIAAVPASTSDLAYPIAPFSVAALFGGVLPVYWGLYVTHNTGQALRTNALNTNSFSFVGIKYDIT